MNRDRDALHTMIHEMGFASAEDDLMRYARPSIRVSTERVSDEAVIPVGASKIGGRPDLPYATEWVRVPFKNEQIVIPFIAQINLRDVKPHDEENLLPDSGMLYFFADFDRPAFADQGRVIYFDGNIAMLERKDFPDELVARDPDDWNERFYPCAVTFAAEVNLPFEVEDGLIYPSGKTWKDLHDLVYATSYRQPPYPRTVNRLLGEKYDVPQDLQLDCQLIADTGSPYDASDAQRQYAESRKRDWQLLFQMDSDKNAGMMWGDAGVLCFYIRREDLQRRDFTNVCLAFFSS